jgi:hypothetical protein
MTSGISDPWQSTGFVLAPSGCQMNLAEGVIRRRLAMRERRGVNWWAVLSMRRGAKSKGFEHPEARSMP